MSSSSTIPHSEGNSDVQKGTSSTSVAHAGCDVSARREPQVGGGGENGRRGQEETSASADAVEMTQDQQHYARLEAAFQRLPSPGIEPGTDPIFLLDQTLQQLVGLLGVLSRERQNLIMQRRELQGEWRKFRIAKAAAPGVLPKGMGSGIGAEENLQRMNSMITRANAARALHSVQEPCGESSEPSTRKRPSVGVVPQMPLGWSKRARTGGAFRAEKSSGSNDDYILSAQSGFFKIRNGQALTERVQWMYDNDDADKEVQFLCGFPEDEIIEVQLSTASRKRSSGKRSKSKGVSWVGQSQSWIARWMDVGKLRTKSFSARKYGYEKAMGMAEEYRKNVLLKRKNNNNSSSSSDIKSDTLSPAQSEESVPLRSPEADGRRNNAIKPRGNPVEPSRAMIDVGKNEGVYYNKSSRTWYIRQREPDGKSRTKGFSILRLGLHPAFEAAVKYRKELNETMKRVKPGVTEGTPMSTPISSPGAHREDGGNRVVSEKRHETAMIPRSVEYDYSIL